MSSRNFKITVFFLVIILFASVLYMNFIHIPYHNYHNNLKVIRNDICETNNYQYDNYFYEHHGKDVYYIVKIKLNNDQYYVAHNTDKQLIASLKGPFVYEDQVKKSIKERYNVEVDYLDVGFENNKFVYCLKIQDENKLSYVYYSVETGEFVKAYYIED